MTKVVMTEKNAEVKAEGIMANGDHFEWSTTQQALNLMVKNSIAKARGVKINRIAYL